jgi:biopolymer transport protein TolQ
LQGADAVHESTLNLLMNMSFVAKLVLFALASFSIVSWSIIVYKWDHFRTAIKENEAFLAAFRSHQSPQELMKKAGLLELSPVAGIYRAAYIHRPSQPARIERLLRRHEAIEAEKLHTYLTFLATTGSTTPFIGLLGTVWGIINAFQRIGATGSASLAVVAPGIAEALITTAAGLAAAIPAVMAYNYFLNAAHKIIVQTEDFSEQLHDILPLVTPPETESDEIGSLQSTRR